MEIETIGDNDSTTLQQALELCKSKQVITNLEADGLIQSGRAKGEFSKYFPCWTSTHLTLKGSKAVVKQGGKTYRFDDVPINNGWYEQDKYGLGLPFGKPSSSSNPKARYLWRVQEYTGLVARYDYWLVNFGRDVGCGDRDGRRGVLARKGGKMPKHKHIFTCECGKTLKR